jgi:hydrogenase maturation protein HypF
MINGISIGKISASFHWWLVDWIAYWGRKYDTRKMAFSGGVFQNVVLVHLIRQRLSDSFDLYFHQELSPNDECIAFGQLALHHVKHLKKEAEEQLQMSVH